MDQPQITAKSALLFDPLGGSVFWTKNDTKRFGMASVTKLMTALLVDENLGLNDVVTFTSADAAQGSRAGLVVGESITVREAYYGLFLESGNDVANMFINRLGQVIAGKPAGPTAIAAGVQMMNDRGLQDDLGFTDTHYIDPHGNNTNEAQHFTSANDLLMVTMAAYARPNLREPMSRLMHTSGGRKWVNGNINLSWYPGCTGCKPGHMPAYGSSLAMASERGSHRLISTSLQSASDLYSEHRALHDYGYWLLGETAEAESLVEETEPFALTFVDTWGTSYNPTIYSGEYGRYSQKVGASATLSMFFSGVSIVGPRGPTRGQADVYVDGVLRARYNARADVVQSGQELFRLDGLPFGAHAVKVVVVGGGLVDIDAFRIRASI